MNKHNTIDLKPTREREIAIQGALLSLLQSRLPLVQMIDIMRVTRTTVMEEGSGEYFTTINGRSFARITLNGPDEFTIKIL